MSKHKPRSLVAVAQDEAREIALDLGDQDYVMSRANRMGLAQNPDGTSLDLVNQVERITGRASKLLIERVVEQCAFPQGLKPSDRRMWAVWQTALGEIDDVTTVKLPKSYVDWLIRVMRRDDLNNVPGALAQWFETFAAYLEDRVRPESGDTSAS